MPHSITIIGTGNVAWHLAPALEQAGHVINEVYGRSEDKALILQERLNNSGLAPSLDFSQSESTLFIIAVSDNAIKKIASEIVLPEQTILVHTSGTAAMSLLQESGIKNIGVFYPLQTISRNRDISFRGLPLLIEASNSSTQDQLEKIGDSLHAETTVTSSKDRKGIHLAAVFANNFTNHMIDIAGQVMREKSLDVNLLTPLIRETVEKALAQSPSSAQTGPAARGDTDTMQNHIQQLEFNPQLQELYRMISKNIRDVMTKSKFTH
ncbi:MAG: DUF2520 domain-containing protein [Gammaproteobacteria bacterium]|nr:DUF2520 domain-containing protein [Gammaproteobacteria bacterium]